jgi:hypothetical protein
MNQVFVIIIPPFIEFALDAKFAAGNHTNSLVSIMATAFPPDFLLVAILSLATAWSVASPFGPSINGTAKGAERTAALRKSVTEAVQLLADTGTTARAARKSKSR